MEGKYIYGIIKNRNDQALKLDGLSTVDFRSLSAVIADAEYKDYHSIAKEEAIKELTGHQQTIEKIMENFGSVLPVKFGTILKDEEEVRSVLEKGHSFLKEALRKMEDKIELDLVCFWDEQKAAQMAYKESESVRNFYKETKPSMASNPMQKIALGKEVANYLATKREQLSSQILRVLKKGAVESCSHVLADVNMLLNQAFLVKKENEEDFNHALNRLDSKFADLVNFRLVGPLPPYSFATVVVDALDKEEVERAKKLLNLGGSTESTLSKVEGLTTGGEVNKDNVKKVYNKLAFKLHPDHGGNPIEFELATESYKLLKKFAEQGLIGVHLYKWEER